MTPFNQQVSTLFGPVRLGGVSRLLRRGHGENTGNLEHAVKHPREKKETIHSHGPWPAKIITEQEIFVAENGLSCST